MILAINMDQNRQVLFLHFSATDVLYIRGEARSLDHFWQEFIEHPKDGVILLFFSNLSDLQSDQPNVINP
jgi:hypothetical protein